MSIPFPGTLRMMNLRAMQNVLGTTYITEEFCLSRCRRYRHSGFPVPPTPLPAALPISGVPAVWISFAWANLWADEDPA